MKAAKDEDIPDRMRSRGGGAIVEDQKWKEAEGSWLVGWIERKVRRQWKEGDSPEARLTLPAEGQNGLELKNNANAIPASRKEGKLNGSTRNQNWSGNEDKKKMRRKGRERE